MRKVCVIVCLTALGPLAGLLAWKSPRPPAPAPSPFPRGALSAALSEPPPQPAAVPIPPPVPSGLASAKAADRHLLRERECLALAERDPLAAMDLAIKENLCAQDPGLLTSLITRWASVDFTAACDWVRGQEAGGWRDGLLARLGYLRAQTDPLEAARIVVSDIAPGPARDEAVISVLHQWALRDIEAARLWAESLPPNEPLQYRALAEIEGIQRFR